MRPSRRRRSKPSTASPAPSWNNEPERDRATMFSTTLHPLLRLDARADLNANRRRTPFRRAAYSTETRARTTRRRRRRQRTCACPNRFRYKLKRTNRQRHSRTVTNFFFRYGQRSKWRRQVRILFNFVFFVKIVLFFLLTCDEYFYLV